MKHTYGERLKLARKHKKLTQPQLFELSGVGQGTISKIERGDQDYSSYDVELAHALDVDPMWLKTGRDEFAPAWLYLNNGPTHKQVFEEAPKLAPAKKIPVVGMAKLGDNGYFVELETPTGFGDGFIEYTTRDENAYAVRCVGDSMKPRIRNGEFVIVSPNQQPISGDDVLIRDKSGRVMIKTLLYIRDDKVHLLSINEAHPPQYIELSQVEIMHYVTAIAPKTAFIYD